MLVLYGACACACGSRVEIRERERNGNVDTSRGGFRFAGHEGRCGRCRRCRGRHCRGRRCRALIDGRRVNLWEEEQFRRLLLLVLLNPRFSLLLTAPPESLPLKTEFFPAPFHRSMLIPQNLHEVRDSNKSLVALKFRDLGAGAGIKKRHIVQRRRV